MAEVPDPSDPGTALNTNVLQMLAEADIVGVMGEASSHCVRETVLQIANNIGQQHVTKVSLGYGLHVTCRGSPWCRLPADRQRFLA
jgi:nicotinamidase/pyrazinamidase